MNLRLYTDLITSEHNDKPNFMAVITALVEPFVDIQVQLNVMPEEYDIDIAVGSQLDTVGKWIGIARDIQTPLVGVFFAFDTVGVGYDEGTWLGPFDDENGLTVLPDDSYRTLLYAKILNNQWDGTVPRAYVFLEKVLPGVPVLQDNGDMTVLLGTDTLITNAVQLALLEHGYLDVKPVGVQISYYVAPSVAGPFFGFDVENSTVSGFGVGGWATLTPGR